jgi:hypothetical protein
MSIVMAKLEPLRSKTAMIVVATAMSLLVGLIVTLVALD